MNCVEELQVMGENYAKTLAQRTVLGLRDTSWQCLQVAEVFRDPFYCYLSWAQAPLVKMAISESFATVDMAPKYLNMFPLLLTEIRI